MATSKKLDDIRDTLKSKVIEHALRAVTSGGRMDDFLVKIDECFSKHFDEINSMLRSPQLKYESDSSIELMDSFPISPKQETNEQTAQPTANSTKGRDSSVEIVEGPVCKSEDSPSQASLPQSPHQSANSNLDSNPDSIFKDAIITVSSQYASNIVDEIESEAQCTSNSTSSEPIPNESDDLQRASDVSVPPSCPASCLDEEQMSNWNFSNFIHDQNSDNLSRATAESMMTVKDVNEVNQSSIQSDNGHDDSVNTTTGTAVQSNVEGSDANSIQAAPGSVTTCNDQQITDSNSSSENSSRDDKSVTNPAESNRESVNTATTPGAEPNFSEMPNFSISTEHSVASTLSRINDALSDKNGVDENVSGDEEPSQFYGEDDSTEDENPKRESTLESKKQCQPIVCYRCFRRFDTIGEKTDHQCDKAASEETTTNGIRCKYCDKQFHKKLSLNGHLSSCKRQSHHKAPSNSAYSPTDEDSPTDDDDESSDSEMSSHHDSNESSDSNDENEITSEFNPGSDSESMQRDSVSTPKMRRKRRSRVRSQPARRCSNGVNNDGSQRAPRLDYNDALDDWKEQTSWSAARKNAWRDRVQNPNGFYYRFTAKGIDENDAKQRNLCYYRKKGKWSDSEHKKFMNRANSFGVNVQWGLFSTALPGRVGYICSNYWRTLMVKGLVSDRNYYQREKGGRFQFKWNSTIKIKEKGYEIMKKFSFQVHEDRSGVFKKGQKHSKYPTDYSADEKKYERKRKGEYIKYRKATMQRKEMNGEKTASRKRKLTDRNETDAEEALSPRATKKRRKSKPDDAHASS